MTGSKAEFYREILPIAHRNLQYLLYNASCTFATRQIFPWYPVPAASLRAKRGNPAHPRTVLPLDCFGWKKPRNDGSGSIFDKSAIVTHVH